MSAIAPIVSVDELVDHPEAVLADVRWYLDGRDGHAAFAAGHLYVVNSRFGIADPTTAQYWISRLPAWSK